MIPELLLLGFGLLGAGGAGGWWWLRRASRDHVIRTRTDWIRAGTIIRYGPVGALCLGHAPRPRYTGSKMGVLGLTDRALIFDGRRTRDQDRDIALAGVRQIALCPVPVGYGLTARQRCALHVLWEDDDRRWHESVFVVEDPLALAEILAETTGAPLHNGSGGLIRYGPTRAARLALSSEGDWLIEREGDLYLASDLLIFNWTEALPLDQITYLDVLGSGRRMLRLETRASGVIGFEVAHPGAWADAIHARSDIPIARHDR